MQICLSTEQLITEKERQKNLCYFFQVSSDSNRLVFRFSYDPKKLEDEKRSRELIEAGLIKDLSANTYLQALTEWRKFLPLNNLITLSLDHEGTYIGCAHRHNPDQEHVIARDYASPGFIPCQSPGGAWRAVVSIHEVVTPACTFRLEVFEEGA